MTTIAFSPIMLLIVLAIVFLVLATVNLPSHPRFNWGWAGMLCWALYVLFVR